MNLKFETAIPFGCSRTAYTLWRRRRRRRHQSPRSRQSSSSFAVRNWSRVHVTRQVTPTNLRI